MIVVFVVSAVTKQRRSGSNADFFSRQQARLNAAPLRIDDAPSTLKRTRSPTPQAPLRNTENTDIWPKYKAYLNQDAYDHYKDSDVTDIANDSAAHALKVDVT